MRVELVFDASVIVSGVCWDGEAHRCLAGVARRQCFAYATHETLGECREPVARLLPTAGNPRRALARWFWYSRVVRMVEPAPLGKQRSRDPKDDPYLAAALAARADFIVTYDNDLLTLKKPFGVGIIRPSQLLQLIKG